MTEVSEGAQMLSRPPYYTLNCLSHHFGAEVKGLNMSTVDLTDTSLINQLKSDLTQHRFLLFRNQSLAGERQVNVSSAFGKVESTFYKHPKSPHPDIFRVSNDPSEGCTNVGRSGWHVDGTFMLTPFHYQTMYFNSVCEGGDTLFVPLKELYESVSNSTQHKWEKLWMVTGRQQAPIHPLVYEHPFRKEVTMLFHCGEPFVRGWLQEPEGMTKGLPDIRLPLIPKTEIQNEITSAINQQLQDTSDTGIVYRMKWAKGDFMINDNLALAHFASEGTQVSSSEVGLRVLHRTTVIGGEETVPMKRDGRRSFVVK
eukprot:GHVN01070605.1.p1 GENE.GHVN01070605.1~~GHVN01070605.1.p1  ORF type:complete len:312 (+),score=77.22 GHVN01070605.1:117-1052(+)